MALSNSQITRLTHIIFAKIEAERLLGNIEWLVKLLLKTKAEQRADVLVLVQAARGQQSAALTQLEAQKDAAEVVMNADIALLDVIASGM